MKYYAFLVLAISWTTVSSEEINGLDKHVFQQVKDVPKVKVTGSKEKAFIETVWSEFSKNLPESAKVPGIEIPFHDSTKKTLEKDHEKVAEETSKSKYWYKNFMCTFECKIYPKFVEPVGTRVVQEDDDEKQKDDGRVVVKVYAVFSLNNEMHYNLFKKSGGSNNALGPIPVSYKFNELSEIKLILDIPDASKLSTITDAKCLVNIRSVDVTVVSKPTPVNGFSSENEKGIADFYWNYMSEYNRMKNTISVAIRREINLKVGKEENYWICITEDFNVQLEVDEPAYKYSPVYDEFCKGGQIAD